MGDTSTWLHHDHQEFGQLLFECQTAVEQEDWKAAKRLFDELVSGLKIHMQMEDEVLFPAYEEVTGTSEGPTRALRDEHDEIVRLLRDLSTVLKTKTSEHVLACLVSLEEVMDRHHEKEEEVFLPMAGHTLFRDRDEILRRLKEFKDSGAIRTRDL